MGISNTIPPSRLIQPGVCTSSTRPTSPFEGQMIYETDTDLLRIWNGSAWKTLAAAAPAQGTILQVVHGSTGSQNSSTSATYIDSNLTATITPQSSSSLILVTYSQNLYTNASATGVGLRLVRTSTVLRTDIDLSYGASSGILAQQSFIYLDSPATTSATTYKTQFCRSIGSGTAFVQANSASQQGNIVLYEVAA